ncbi:hypothetical protein WN944_019402 [Citrus x changshan-huyou]|uniref:Uncharacterized protein n=1 Tax=Citrus x changshan-huyou TaxID=2935761 RepID=A0AAP0LV68_9ROSI
MGQQVSRKKGDWKELEFKEYNFNAKAQPADPLLKDSLRHFIEHVVHFHKSPLCSEVLNALTQLSLLQELVSERSVTQNPGITGLV